MKTRFVIFLLIVSALGVILLASQPPAAAAEDALSGRAAELRHALQNPALDAQLRTSLEEKLEMELRMQSERAAGQAAAAPKQPDTPPDFGSPASLPAQPPSGIFEGGEAIIRGAQADILNHWQDFPDGQLTQVYAGLVTDDPEQGVLFVVTWVEDVPRITRHLTPTRDGPARLLEVAEGLLLRVQTSGGSSWLFDWRSGEFR